MALLKVQLQLLVVLFSTAFCQLPDRPSEECPYLQAQNTLISILEDASYDSLTQPELPVVVNISILMRDVSEVNEIQRYTSFLLALTQTWFDHRLNSILPSSCPGNLAVPLNPSLHNKIWKPPTRFPNAIFATTTETPHLAEGIFVTPRGQVTYTRSLEASFPCVTDYVKFPSQ